MTKDTGKYFLGPRPRVNANLKARLQAEKQGAEANRARNDNRGEEQFKEYNEKLREDGSKDLFSRFEPMKVASETMAPAASRSD